eukprot:TRINITY_DN685_c0_g5_i1.p1 TRINITY_DN685_c0_g5~~TRINITY_DN685_c0_g5_i1.p1  ORF type:complete len:414 (+),score=65.78 TRINITY_DN685_c0_g5_i1:524-1765(+)
MVALINRSALDVDESLETLRQNVDSLNTLINIKTPLAIADKDKPFLTSTMNFQIGQWVDVKDSIDQWLEGQIAKLRGNRAFIHYNGWGNRWDEWIDLTSPRIALFRTHTIQMPTNKYISPSPNIKPDAENHEIVQRQINSTDILGQTSNLLERLRNMAELYLNLSRHEEQLNRIAIGEERKTGAMEEKRKQQLAAQLAPLMDRLGRVLIDLSPHLYATAYTETEQAEERKVDRGCKVPLIDSSRDVSMVTNIMDRLMFAETPRIELHIHASLNQQALNTAENRGNARSGENARESGRSEISTQTEEIKKSDAGVGTEVRRCERQMQTELQVESLPRPSPALPATKTNSHKTNPRTNVEKTISPVIGKQSMKRTIIRSGVNQRNRNANEADPRLINPVARSTKHKTVNPPRLRK